MSIKTFCDFCGTEVTGQRYLVLRLTLEDAKSSADAEHLACSDICAGCISWLNAPNMWAAATDVLKAEVARQIAIGERALKGTKGGAQ